MKKKTKNLIGLILAMVGFLLIIAKLIYYFIPGKALVPGLTLIGLLLVIIGMWLRKG